MEDLSSLSTLETNRLLLLPWKIEYAKDMFNFRFKPRCN